MVKVGMLNVSKNICSILGYVYGLQYEIDIENTSDFMGSLQ